MKKRKIVNMILSIIILLSTTFGIADTEIQDDILYTEPFALLTTDSSIKDGAEDIPIDYRMVLVFNRNIASSDIINSNKKLINLFDSSGNSIPIEVVPYISDQNEEYLTAVEIKPNEELKKGSSYIIKIDEGIESEGKEDRLNSAYSINFNTERDNLINQNEEANNISDTDSNQNTNDLESDVELARRQNKIIEENMKKNNSDKKDIEGNNIEKPTEDKNENAIKENPKLEEEKIKEENEMKNEKSPVKFFLILFVLVAIIVVIILIVNKMNREKENKILEEKMNREKYKANTKEEKDNEEEKDNLGKNR